MSNFVDQSLLMKEIDSDTYMLFPLIKNEHDQVVLNNNDKNAKDLIKVLTEKLRNEADIQNLDLSKLNVESIDTTDKLLNEFFTKIYQTDFRTLLDEQLPTCFPDLEDEVVNMDVVDEVVNMDVVDEGDAMDVEVDDNFSWVEKYMSDSFKYTHYGMFSYQNILNSLSYWMLSFNKDDINHERLYPYSFMSMYKDDQDNVISIKENPQSEWKSTDYYFIYNVCKSNKIKNKKGICSNMINIITNSEYAQKPLFLFVDKNNKAALNCYTKNKFQKVEDIFSGKTAGRPVGIKMKTENDMYMCYNKDALKMSFANDPENPIEYELMPVGSYRITLVAHGAVDLNPTDIFQKGFDINDNYKQYVFPFKNMQYYAKFGAGVSLREGVDEQTAIYDVCYDTIISTNKDEPVNKTISTIPLLFHGFKKDDPESRKNFIGLYDCNMKKRIKENTELFGENNEKYIHMDNVFQIIFTYCFDHDIPYENVEIKIFACRGFCPVKEYTTLAMNGGNDDEYTSVESSKDYKSVDKTDLFDYLKKEMSTCDLPKKGGKKNKKKPTRQHRKKPSKNKTRKHKKYT